MSKPDYMMTSKDGVSGIAATAAELGPWFHNIHLPDGTQTAPGHPLGDFPAFKWRQIAAHLPADLSGWRVLDIGCNAGFYCIELAKRGAQVTGLDVDAHFLRQAEWVATVFQLEDRITLRQGQVYDLARSKETFDLILFMGVFYHLRYPLLALDLVAERVGRLLLFQTLTMPGEAVLSLPKNLRMEQRSAFLDAGWPKMAFIEHALAGDPTNWWASNDASIRAMLRTAGMDLVRQPGREIYLCEPSARVTEIREERRPEIDAATGRAIRPGR